MSENIILTDAMRRILIARERIARRTPFFASIVYNARVVESDQYATIVTDGIRIYFNPEYVAAADPFIEGDMLKCIMHLAMQHPERKQHREMKKWGESCTCSIGPLVHGYFQQAPELMAKDTLFPDMAAEEVYEKLPDPPPGNAGAGGSGQDEGEAGDSPGGMVSPQGSEDEQEAASKQWKRAVDNAVNNAVKAGNMPRDIKRRLEEITPDEKLDWRELARDMSRDAKSRVSQTWARPNRRRSGLEGDPIMPGNANDNIFNLMILFDVSGSVDKDMFRDMRMEVAGLMDQDLVNQATLIAVDTEPNSVSVVSNSQGVLDWEPRGGGGTNFKSVMELVNKEYGNSIGLIFLTDLETSDFGREPPFPVVWVNFGKNKRLCAPFGRTVDY